MMQKQRPTPYSETESDLCRKLAALADGLGQLSEDDCACLDLDRARRCGFPEFVFGGAKTSEQLLAISAKIVSSKQNLLITRITPSSASILQSHFPQGEYDALAGTFQVIIQPPPELPPEILIITAGTGDLPAAREALHTIEACGMAAELLPDVGVSALHRLLRHIEKIRQAAVCIVVAGMDGALPSVVAGLTANPVIAVPTSVGYGASFKGLSPLLGMLNSCSNGLCVVNIDNGFGAACAAVRILKTRHRENE